MKKKKGKKVTRKKVSRKVKHKVTHKRKKVVREKSPNFVIQLDNPTELRKDVLETLREIIIFMQSYEAFRKIQDEKILAFANLRTILKELSTLMNTQLPKYLPKGKIKPFAEMIPKVKKPAPMSAPKPQPTTVSTPEPSVSKHDQLNLDDLEYQLKDIERQLQNVK